MFSSTITRTMTEVKRYIYLSLRKKPLVEQILDDIEEEAEERLKILVKQKLPFLQKCKPEDPQAFLENFLLRGFIHILDDMLKERSIKLSMKDKQELENIFEEEKVKGQNLKNDKGYHKNIPKKNTPPHPQYFPGSDNQF